MAQLTQLVGIIELDADPELDATLDENISQTLRRLRSVAPEHNNPEHNNPEDFGPESAGLAFCCSSPAWKGIDEALSDRVVVLKTDLRQLHWELESELAKLLDRLFATL